MLKYQSIPHRGGTKVVCPNGLAAAMKPPEVQLKFRRK